jgi:hypothetical protein
MAKIKPAAVVPGHHNKTSSSVKEKQNKIPVKNDKKRKRKKKKDAKTPSVLGTIGVIIWKQMIFTPQFVHVN